MARCRALKFIPRLERFNGKVSSQEDFSKPLFFILSAGFLTVSFWDAQSTLSSHRSHARSQLSQWFLSTQLLGNNQTPRIITPSPNATTTTLSQKRASYLGKSSTTVGHSASLNKYLAVKPRITKFKPTKTIKIENNIRESCSPVGAFIETV